MNDFDIILWDDEDDPQGNIHHMAEHDVSPEEVEDVLYDPRSIDGLSRSSGRPLRRGVTSAGREILVVYEWIHESGIVGLYPITAYEPSEGLTS